MDRLLVSSLSKRCLLIVALAALSYSLCSSCLPPRPSSECRAFYDLSPRQRVERIRTSTVENQLVLYECGMYQEPPTDFAGVVADGGVKIVPIVFDQLSGERSETRQDQLIHVFEELAVKGHLRGKRDVADQIGKVVSAMKDDDLKRTSEQRLGVINENL
jgi:hypothetical protein